MVIGKSTQSDDFSKLSRKYKHLINKKIKKLILISLTKNYNTILFL